MIRLAKLMLIVSFLFLGYEQLLACGSAPIASSCAPSTLNYCCGFGITNVTFNTINNTTNDGIDGYTDSSCVQTTVLEGQVYTLSIQTVSQSTQNYAAWIDFNNDGIFNDVTERVFTASSQLNTSGSVAIPVGAVLNTPLRMRISAEYDLLAPPLSCVDLDYGQAEDYGIIITANPNPPIPIFTASTTTTCSGTVCFTDQSINAPTGWLWNFGDGNTSFQPNPCHTYAADGVYTITLTVTNANGGNVDSIVNYITVNTAGQVVSSSCNPVSLAYCCGYGIYQVDFNTISNASLDGVEGYRDFSCMNSTTVTEGVGYLLTVTTGTNNPQDTRAWIDFNNDGVFNNTNELVMDIVSSYNPSLNLIIPTGAVLNIPLRMRISSDVVGVTQSSCDANDFGQTEDYAVIIQPNTLPPTSSFVASITSTCSDSICFTDLSAGAPTGWTWYFGDGNTSNQPNPCYTYITDGIYTVSLVTTNAFGQDSIAFVNYININCTNVDMPISGVNTLTSCTGNLYDDGGPSGNYSNSTDGVVVIQPPGATQISINFTFFSFEDGFDFVTVYDGPSILSPVLGTFTGNTLPGAINSSGGSITIRQETDGVISGTGFDMSWVCSGVSVEEKENLADNYIIYPNPASYVIKIKMGDSNELNIQGIKLFNSIGQIALQEGIKPEETTIQIDVAHLPKGLYFLNIESKKGITTKKINIQ